MSESENESKKAKILVVEDDVDALQTLTIMLEKMGHSVHGYSMPTEALEAATGIAPDLMMLDIMMPELNGYELLAKLREIPEYTELPAIIVTAKDQDDDLLEGYNRGAQYYITKPYTMQQVEYALNLYLGS